MDTIQIPCPKCGSELKLRDRSLLGRRGKCPKCSHAFVLEEPDEVQLELAEPEPTVAGTAARWIPDEVAPTPVVPRSPAPRAQAPQTQTPVPQMPVAPAASFALQGLEELAAPDGPASRLKALQKRNAKNRNIGLAIGAVGMLALGGAAFYAMNNPPAKPGAGERAVADKDGREADDADAAPQGAASGGTAASNDRFASTGKPTKGKPIDLQFIPFGTQVAINIHPAALWKEESKGEEVRFCLTAPAKFLEATLQDLFKRKPEQIEEALICLIPGAQGSKPEVAAVIHLVEEAKKSQLLEDFGGARVDDYGHPVYVTEERAYLIQDQKTIAVGPKGQASEMVQAITGRNPAADGIDELLPLTDRDRHLTFIFVPRTLRLHANYWFAGADAKPTAVAPFVHRFCDWLGDEVESAVWSFHLGEKIFYSDMLLRNMAGVTASRFSRDTQKKLDQFPRDLLEAVQMMNPREVGKRKVIGRLPIMSDAFTMATQVSNGPRHVQLITPLPERAAPNLALGTLLAWDESTRTDFTKKAPTKAAPSDGSKLPDLIADRLKLKIDIDFRRTPLQEAFAYISGEIKTTIDIDGDALKFGGYTKNMTQDLKLDAQQVKTGIWKILEKYQDPVRPEKHMVIVVDEAKKLILVTTQASCTKNNLTPFDVSK